MARSGGLTPWESDCGQELAAMQQQLETLYRSATVPIWWGPAVSCWAMFPDTAVRRDHHRVGCPVLRPGLQGREI
ncbi:hypothetical protein CEY02_20200, partial [Bacillus pumilus]